MTSQRELTRRDRLQAAERLGELAEEVERIGQWLDRSGDHAADKAAVIAECARRDLAAAWLIKPADHSKPPGWLTVPQPAVTPVQQPGMGRSVPHPQPADQQR